MEFLMFSALINNTNKSSYKWKRGIHEDFTRKKIFSFFACLNKIKLIILYNIRNSIYLCMTLNNQMKRNKAKLTNHCWICKHPDVWHWIDKTSGSWTEIFVLKRQVQITLFTVYFHNLFLSQSNRCVTPTKEMEYRVEKTS